MTAAGGALPRLLTIMGSGETAPTMIKVHRAVIERLGPGPVHGVLLDTPFGFQTNAPDIAARAVDYFRDSVGAVLEVAGLRSAADLEPPHGDEVIARLVAAPFIFSGPGSPTYALRQWRGTLVPAVLAEKLALGGAVTFASAAALALGAVAVPVYEVYKVGEEARWVEGLDLLGPLGLPVALIPHYDNAEGGTHDTRFSYLGEQRLAGLEEELPEGVFVLGVDEHTALCLDLDAGSALVAGRGGVTVRAGGVSARIESGRTLPIERLAEMADELAHSPGPRQGNAGPGAAEPGAVGSGPPKGPEVVRPPAGEEGHAAPRSHPGPRGGLPGRPGRRRRRGHGRRHPGPGGGNVVVAGRHPAVRRDGPGPGRPADHGVRARPGGRGGYP